MSWDALAWTRAEGGLFDALPPIKPMWPLIKSGLEESVAAAIQGPATIGEVESTEIDAAELPSGFEPVACFELLGAERRGVWAGLDPSGGTVLGGTPQTAAGLQALLLEGLDGVLQAVVGDGLAMTPPDGLREPTGRLLLLRLPITDSAGSEVISLLAVDVAVPGELAAHVLALKALNENVAIPPSPSDSAGAAPTAASPAPASAASAPSQAAPDRATPPVPPAAHEPAAPPSPPILVTPVQLPEFSPPPATSTTYNIDLLLGVNLEVSVEIGRTRLPIRDVLSLAPGSVVELDKLAGEKVDVLVNGRSIASGEVVVVDENFGVRITDVVSRQHRILSADAAR